MGAGGGNEYERAKEIIDKTLHRERMIRAAFLHEVTSKLKDTESLDSWDKKEIEILAEELRKNMKTKHPVHYANLIKHIEF